MSGRIRHLYRSSGHNFFGHHGREPDEHPIEERSEIECLAGRGIAGDRFCDYREDYKGQITFFAGEVFEALCEEFGVRDKSPAAFRRNVVTSGFDLAALIGREFKVQEVRFMGMCECKPCYWMDQAFHPGTEERLQGQGGLRAKILSSGLLRVADARLQLV